MTRAFASLLLGLLAAAAMAAGATPATELHVILADYDRYLTEVDPIAAEQRGDLAALARWPDDSPKAVEGRRLALADIKSHLAALEGAPLSDEENLNRDLLHDRVDLDLAGFTFDEERVPFNSGDGFFTVPDYAADGIVLRTETEARTWIAKIEALPAYYATEIANLRRGVATGFVRPRLIVETVAMSLQKRAAQRAEDHPLLHPLAVLPQSLAPELRASLMAEALEGIRSRVKPAEQALTHFFENEYLPHGAAAIGIGELPNGKSYYAYLIRRHASTQMSAERIHAIGLEEVARIDAEMQRVIAATGFTGDRAAFVNFLRADKRFQATSVDDYLEKTRDVAKRTDALLPQYFGTLPRLTYGVRLVPPALKGSSAGYYPGSPEQGIAGSVIVNIDANALDQSPLFGMPAWALHEGVPGHHLQIALAQERTERPLFRRNSDVNAYVEGWALYSEHLGIEMGIYRTPYEDFGRLSLEMWRACRLVVDTGMHVMGWTRERAVACLRDHSALSQRAIEMEIDRYISWPGQALGYKIGELRIRELRARAEKALGSKFDIRAFHDAILVPGPMPLDILERRIDQWIKGQQ